MIARVFPRRTSATPTDALAFTAGPGLFPPDVDEVRVSVAFKWDLPAAERLAREWAHVAPVTIGGPAAGMRGEEFTPGLYLREGHVITSRGCPNGCWFCDVPRREGNIRELPVAEGWIVQDDNLLACSEEHVRAVFEMLGRQRERVHFKGGLEAARLQPWHVEALRALHPKQMFFAYDEVADLEPLREAGRMLLAAGFTRESHSLRCYVLCGWPKDRMEDADRRMRESLDAGFVPMAMLWRGKDGSADPEWRAFQREWARPAIIAAKIASGEEYRP